jgi:hypothetical protein
MYFNIFLMWVVHTSTMGIAKYDLKEKAIALRKEGYTYSEILRQIPIAKSTLSDWLHSVDLSKHQKQLLTEKKLAAAKRGGAAKHQQRLDKVKAITKAAKVEIGSLSNRELWLMGTMLYWAEGSKEKDWNPGSGVRFTNMDPAMICFFLKWLKEICNIGPEELIFQIYIHDTHRNRIGEIIKFWSQKINLPSEFFTNIYFKRSNIKTVRKNIDVTYFGVIRITVRSSASLQRRIAGWTQGVVEFSR